MILLSAEDTCLKVMFLRCQGNRNHHTFSQSVFYLLSVVDFFDVPVSKAEEEVAFVMEIRSTHLLQAETILIMGPLAVGQNSLLMNHSADGSFSLGTVIKPMCQEVSKGWIKISPL